MITLFQLLKRRRTAVSFEWRKRIGILRTIAGNITPTSMKMTPPSFVVARSSSWPWPSAESSDQAKTRSTSNLLWVSHVRPSIHLPTKNYHLVLIRSHFSYEFRDQSRYAPSQWETSLHCNDVFHWLGAYLEWSLLLQYQIPQLVK